MAPDADHMPLPPTGHLLVGLDASSGSSTALRWAAWFAALTNRRLHLAHAWQYGGRLDGVVVEPAEAGDESLFEARVVARLRDLAIETLGDDSIVAKYHALRGLPAESLFAEAARTDAHLVVVGATGAGLVRRATLGSVSRRLTEGPSRAVAVVPDPGVTPLTWNREIAVGVDGSAGSSRALRWAAENAHRSGATLLVIHAFEPPIADLTEREVTSLVEESRRRLEDEWCAPLRDLGVPYRAIVGAGDPRDVLRRAIASARPGLIVMGSRGLGGFTKLLLGSVTHELLRDGTTPTVIIPSPRDCPAWEL